MQETMRQRIAEGKLFTDYCEGLPEDRLAAKRRMKRFNEIDPADTQGRTALIAEILGAPANAWIEPPFYFCYGTNITIGDGTYINVNCSFIDDGRITIGERVMFGPSVNIATVSHPINPAMREFMFADPVTIGDDCWIGANVTICPGVTIGEGTTIGAGSVVTHDIPAHTVAVGVPCRVLREISETDMAEYRPGMTFADDELVRETKAA
ncbi:sugar O-acetyltransferase [Bifidobacterium miconisargentati]|uniref:sugar O-acetyltransferase n=1 Tax=Bifidobacterium miconisargentati TaxID=2834437 RepID=UPI001BDCB460|nr:sugar O-acetyltransferase [Bifidobacterium miconisargentati]MBW3091096.1 sugar O-acetyltransferase [Bifidobacterium miconisargentati]